MTFTDPLYLYLLLLVPLFALFLIWRDAARAAVIRRIGDEALVRRMIARISPARRRWKALLWLLSVSFVILALAGPVWGTRTEVIEREGVTLVLAIDVSRSMDAQDILPSRLGRTRLDLRQVLDTLEASEVGIALFAAEAYRYMPRTSDHQTVEKFLRAISTDAVTAQGTSLENAIRVAITMFDDQPDREKHVILASDGEAHEGDHLRAAEEAAQQGITVHTLGYGTSQGAAIPIFDERGDITDYKTDAGGALVQTYLREEVLRDIADLTGGLYIRVEEGAPAIDRLINLLQTVEAEAVGEHTVQRPIARFAVFAALALLALTLEIVLPETHQEQR